MNLYRKYRPQTLQDVKGNADLINILEGLFERNDVPNAILLHGPTGCGKTTIARIVADKLGCSKMDLAELNTADMRGIDTIREIIRNSSFNPMQGAVRVWIIDECHKLTNDAQNALLKILEDTPSHVYFILCTTDPQKLIAAIRGRCSQFQVRPLTNQQMFGLLRKIVDSEGIDVGKEALTSIVNSATGLPRNAITMLEQIMSLPAEQQAGAVQKAINEQVQSIDLCRALIKGEQWASISDILKKLEDQDPEAIRRVVLGYCKSVLLNNDNEKAASIMEEFVRPFYDSGFPQLVYACYIITKN